MEISNEVRISTNKALPKVTFHKTNLFWKVAPRKRDLIKEQFPAESAVFYNGYKSLKIH